MKGRSDVTIERRCGRMLEFGCTSVAKRSQPPKNQDLTLAQNDAVKVNLAEDGDQAGMGHIIQLWIFCSCNTTGAIDVFTRRVWRWEMNHFVVAL